MRFKAILNNPIGLYKIIQTLEKLGKSCVVSFANEEVRFTTYKEDETTVPAWVKMKAQSIFSSYRVESKTSEINFFITTHDLSIVLKGLQESISISVSLQARSKKSILVFESCSTNPYGTTTDERSEIEVVLIATDRMSLIRDPTTNGVPDTYIFLPSVSALKPAADKFKILGKFMTLSANMNGVFKIEIETPAARGQAVFTHLGHPELRGHQQPDREVNSFSKVRIRTEDFVHFLNCYYLNPSNVICSISDEVQLSFFVYLSIDSHQNEDAPIRTFNPLQTTMTCHLPVYIE